MQQKFIFLLILILSTFCGFGQQVFLIDNFSEDYYGKINIDDSSDVFSPGWVAIYDRKSNKEVIKVVSEELSLSLHEGQALANIRSLPYGEQSLIQHDDFNFDGKKDFAICDGQNSCYHGPSYQVYLSASKGFTYNKDFTRLAQEYCGMFNTDPNTRRITTMTKSGCCWHEFSEFSVVNNKPKAILVVTEEYSFPFHVVTEEKWNGKAMVKKTVKTLNPSDLDIVISFDVPANNKQVILYNLNDRMLYYALLRKDSTVEFSFPAEAVYQNPDFRFDSTASQLSVTFINRDAVYTIYEKPSGIGITINTGGKKYEWKGSSRSKQGSLGKLPSLGLENLQ